MSSKVSNSTILGAAAEHWVMAQLLRMNRIAALAPAGVPDADIIVSDRHGTALTAVQVKARRDIGADGGWHMKKKHEELARPTLFYCLVDFGKAVTDPPSAWIIPSATVADVLKRSHARWLALPGRTKPHADSDMRRLLPSYDYMSLENCGAGWLDQYRDRWDLIAPPEAEIIYPKKAIKRRRMREDAPQSDRDASAYRPGALSASEQP